MCINNIHGIFYLSKMQQPYFLDKIWTKTAKKERIRCTLTLSKIFIHWMSLLITMQR